jgi:hypothetical protein
MITCWRWADGEDLRLPPQTAGFVRFLAATADQHRDRAAMRAGGVGEDLRLPPHTACFVHFLAATADQHASGPPIKALLICPVVWPV